MEDSQKEDTQIHMTIVYRLGNKLYLNITNACSCDCVFCLRNKTDGVGNAPSLWLEREPSLEEIKHAINKAITDATDGAIRSAINDTASSIAPQSSSLALAFDEIVFCGFGEPMMRADIVIETCEYIKNLPIYKGNSDLLTQPIQTNQHNNRNHSSLYGKPAPPVRVNTNGLAFLMSPGFDVSRLAVVDTVSISLNADDADEYLRTARPKYGLAAFDSLLDFAAQAKAYTNVVFSIVEGTISAQRLENCKRISKEMGIPLRIRPAE